MLFTIVPIVQEDPPTFGAEFLAVDTPELLEWKKELQAIHPRLLPQLKESALLSEEESEFCVLGGLFAYERGEKFVVDGVQYKLSHCAENFFDFLLAPAECLAIVEEKRAAFANVLDTEVKRNLFATICAWWKQGYRVLFLQH